MNHPIISFQKINYSYYKHRDAILKDLSFDVEKDSVTAILGPNGAGKTTLLHLVLGWLKPETGKILLKGKSLNLYTRRELGQMISLVPQNEHIPFEYSVLEYVLLGRAPYLKPLEMPGKNQCKIAEEAVKMVGLEKYLNRHVTELSGGEHQLMLLARSLAQKPDIMLLDEPTANLDLKNKVRILKLLKKLASHSVTIILTSHEPDVVNSVGTRMVCMVNGMVKKTGTVSEIMTGKTLTETYGFPVEVTNVSGVKFIQWFI